MDCRSSQSCSGTTADAWKPERYYVAGNPLDPTVIPNRTTGRWVLSGDAAAAAFGAPIVVARPRPRLYLPTTGELRRVARLLGPASADDATAVLSQAPVDLVHLDSGRSTSPYSFPVRLAHPVIVALDLAQDQARGREILADWTPEDFVRVW